jgi:nucleoid-associated protein YgaU
MANHETKPHLAIIRVVFLVLAGATACWFMMSKVWPPAGLAEVVAFPPAVIVPAPPPAVVPPSTVGVATAGEAPRFDVVRVAPGGQAIIAGKAQPGAEVVVRDGNTELARVRADSGGAFVALPAEPLKPGSQELTLASRSVGGDEVKGSGTVMLVIAEPAVRAGPAPMRQPAAVAVVVQDAAPPGGLPGTGAAERAGSDDRVTVHPGQSLWRLARAAYGHGMHYAELYLANRNQIHDPRLIYPGQTFSVPVLAPPRH